MKKKVTKKKLNVKKLCFFLILLFCVIYVIHYFWNLKIKNIYINNNKYIYINSLDNSFNEQQVLEIAGIDNYPKTLFLSTKKIKNKLVNDIYIKDAKVEKKGLTTLNITIYENRPLMYNANTFNTVLETGDEVDKKFNVPTLINYVPNEVYKKLIIKMNDTNDSILNHISEIKYDPNSVDDERFLFTMTDGNYVYITLERFNLINKYLEIISSVNGKKGILYLDYGDHFVFE